MELLISVSSPSSAHLSKFKEDLVKLCQTYYQAIPLKAIEARANLNGIKMVDEDGTDWEGFLTGRDGRASIDLAEIRTGLVVSTMHIQWHKMESGKYEINAYTD